MKTSLLSVVIPCYNEAQNIPLILKRFSDVCSRTDVEVILVNNGSTDNTEEVLALVLPLFPFATSIKVHVNQGYGYGILQGLQQANGEFVGWTHADMQTDPEDVLSALSIIEKQSSPETSYIKGLRRSRPFGDTIFTFAMSIFETILLGTPLWDINAQPNIFHNTFFESWESPPKDFSLDLYALYMAKHANLNIVRFDVQFPKRIYGSSSWNSGLSAKWKFIKRTIDFSIKLKTSLKKNPV